MIKRKTYHTQLLEKLRQVHILHTLADNVTFLQGVPMEYFGISWVVEVVILLRGTHDDDWYDDGGGTTTTTCEDVMYA
jgi:hypothetical protein